MKAVSLTDFPNRDRGVGPEWCHVRSLPNHFLVSLVMLVALPILCDGNPAWAGYIPCESLHQPQKALLPNDCSLVGTGANAQALTTLLVNLRSTGGGCDAGPQEGADNPPGRESPSNRTPPAPVPWHSALQAQHGGGGMAPTGTGSGNGPSSPPVAFFTKPEVPLPTLVNYLRADNPLRPPTPFIPGLFHPPRDRSWS
jgi:hypothetical protein